jgi:prefoldin alpha subunit
MQRVELSQLGIQELNQIGRTVSQEVEVLTTSAAQLRVVQRKFLTSREAVDQLHGSGQKATAASGEVELHIPLTSSLYVRGKLESPDRVLVDVGTGYYIDMKQERAVEYLQRRADYVAKEAEKVEAVLRNKQMLKAHVSELLNEKIEQYMAAEQLIRQQDPSAASPGSPSTTAPRS